MKKNILYSLIILVAVFVNSNIIFSKEENKEMIEYKFVTMLNNLNDEKIKKELDKLPIFITEREINGIKIELDNQGEIIKNNTEKYKNSKFAIAINRKEMVLTVYAFNDKNEEYNIPIISFPISCNYKKTPLGVFYTSDMYRWQKMFGNNNYCQYCIRFNGHFLMHSVIYKKNDIYTLRANTYNGIIYKLQSSGCVRLRVKDAKWLFDRVVKGTMVVVYDGIDTSPFGREEFNRIPENQCFDPTDSEINLMLVG